MVFSVSDTVVSKFVDFQVFDRVLFVFTIDDDSLSTVLSSGL